MLAKIQTCREKNCTKPATHFGFVANQNIVACAMHNEQARMVAKMRANPFYAVCGEKDMKTLMHLNRD